MSRGGERKTWPICLARLGPVIIQWVNPEKRGTSYFNRPILVVTAMMKTWMLVEMSALWRRMGH